MPHDIRDFESHGDSFVVSGVSEEKVCHDGHGSAWKWWA